MHYILWLIQILEMLQLMKCAQFLSANFKFYVSKVESFYFVKYRISDWAEFQVWKFLHLLKLAQGKKSLPPKDCRPAGGKAFLPKG